MVTHLTNNKLNQLLLDLGFRPGEAIERNRRAWRHPESGCELCLRVNKLEEPPQSADLVGIRAQLALHGHLDEESFDYFASEGRLPVPSSD